MKFGVRVLHVVLLSIYEFLKTGAGWDIKEITFRLCLETVRHFESKERLGKVCVGYYVTENAISNLVYFCFISVSY